MTPNQPLIRRAAWAAAGLRGFRGRFRAHGADGRPHPLRDAAGVALRLRGRPGHPRLPGCPWPARCTVPEMVAQFAGYPGPEVSPLPGPGVLRVVATGASETFGQSEGPGREYPRQLEDSLRASLPGAVCARTSRWKCSMPPFSACRCRRPPRTSGSGCPVSAGDRGALPHERAVSQRRRAEGRRRRRRRRRRARAGAAILRPRTLTRLREELKRVAPRAWREWLWQAQVRRQLAGHEPGWRYTEVPLDRLARLRGRSAGLHRRGAVHRRGAGAGDAREPVRGRHRGRFVAARCMAALLSPSRRAGHPGV